MMYSMFERPIARPHLPTARVTLAAVSATEMELAAGLRRMHIESLPVCPAASLGEGSLSSHADMLICHIEREKLLLDTSQSGLIPALKKRRFDAQISSIALTETYPEDCRLNCVRIGNHVFCGRSAAPELLAYWEELGLEICFVRQGYCKCNLCILSEEAVITSDLGLAGAVKAAGVDVLIIRPGYIALPGYGYGFLGGASGKLAPDILGFCGEISEHPDYASIRDFAAMHGVSVLSVCGGELRDCGGILPLCERIEK